MQNSVQIIYFFLLSHSYLCLVGLAIILCFTLIYLLSLRMALYLQLGYLLFSSYGHLLHWLSDKETAVIFLEKEMVLTP